MAPLSVAALAAALPERGTIEAVCRSAGLTPPIICTPEELRIGRAHGCDADRIALTIRQHECESGRPVIKVTLPRTTATAQRRRRQAAQPRHGAVGA